MFSKAKQIIIILKNNGAKEAFIVGGYVRDKLLNIESKDIDIEVYGLSYEEIINILCDYNFNIDIVGKNFGVIKVDNNIDINLPRKESRIGVGHKDFNVLFKSNITSKEAAERRDFTINSMFMDIDGNIIDYFGGKEDIKNKILRHTSEKFIEDPLRVLRGFQFAARFGFKFANETIELAKSIKDQFKYISSERIFEEWKKWALKGKYHSYGLQVLKETEWLENFSELYNLDGLIQDSEHHPEGDVYTHIKLTVDAANEISKRRNLSEEEHMIIMFASLLHDVGKAITTVKTEDGKITTKQHDKLGVNIAESFLRNMKADNKLIENVLPLISEHMAHINFYTSGNVNKRVVRRLANRLDPSNIKLWSVVVEADHSGRYPLPKSNPVEKWEEIAKDLNINGNVPKQILMGRHLIKIFNMKPGIEIGKILKIAFEAQLNGEFDNIDDAIKWIKLKIL